MCRVSWLCSRFEKIWEHIVLRVRFLWLLLGLLLSWCGSLRMLLIADHHLLHHSYHLLHLLEHSHLLSLVLLRVWICHHAGHHLLHLHDLLLLHRLDIIGIRSNLSSNMRLLEIILAYWILTRLCVMLGCLKFLLLLMLPILLLLFKDKVRERVFRWNCLGWDPWHEFWCMINLSWNNWLLLRKSELRGLRNWSGTKYSWQISEQWMALGWCMLYCWLSLCLEGSIKGGPGILGRLMLCSLRLFKSCPWSPFFLTSSFLTIFCLCNCWLAIHLQKVHYLWRLLYRVIFSSRWLLQYSNLVRWCK